MGKIRAAIETARRAGGGHAIRIVGDDKMMWQAKLIPFNLDVCKHIVSTCEFVRWCYCVSEVMFRW